MNSRTRFRQWRLVRFICLWGFGVALCLSSFPSVLVPSGAAVNFFSVNFTPFDFGDRAHAAEPPPFVSTANPPSPPSPPNSSTAPFESNPPKNAPVVPTPETIVTQNNPSQTAMTVPSLWWAQQHFGEDLVESWRAYTGQNGQRRVDVVINSQAWNRRSYLAQYAFITQFGSNARQFGYSTWLVTDQGDRLGQYSCDFQPTLPNSVRQTAAANASHDSDQPAEQLASTEFSSGLLLAGENAEAAARAGETQTAPATPPKCQVSLESEAIRETFGAVQTIGGGIGQ